MRSNGIAWPNCSSRSGPFPKPSTGRSPPGVDVPAKDRPILQAAIAAKATHLITGDVTHFGEYFGRQIGGVLILAPGDYLRDRERE